MKKIFLLFTILQLTSCITLQNGRVPEKRDAGSGSVIAIRLVSENSILTMHMKTGWFYERMQKFGDYYVLFNVPPGKYEIDHGDAIDQQFFFDKEFIKSSSVEITNQEFVFLGAFNLKVGRQAEYYTEVNSPLIINSRMGEARVTYFYFDFPQKQDDITARKEFVLFMQDKIKGTPWKSVIR